MKRKLNDKPSDVAIVRDFIEREHFARCASGLPKSHVYIRDSMNAQRALERIAKQLQRAGA